MRRPLALAGFTLLFAHLLCMFLGEHFSLIAALCSFVVLLLLFFIKFNNNRLRTSLRGCCFLLLCGCLCFFLQFQTQIKPLDEINGTKQYLTFTVLEKQGTYEGQEYYVVKANGMYPADENKSCKVRLVVPKEYSLHIGEHVGAAVSISANPHPSLMAQDIYLTAYYEEEVAPQILENRHPLSYYTNKAKAVVKTAIYQSGSDDAAVLVSGICLGESDNLSPALQKAFYGVGLGHLVAVSGLHTSQIGGVFIGLFLLIAKRKRFVKLCSLPFVWGFVLLTGASYSSIRAAIMFSFFALGSCLLRKMDSLNTLGGAITLILLLHPFSVGSLGFLASVSACAGLILLSTPLYERIMTHLPARWQSGKVAAYLVGGLSATCSALLFTIPCNFLGFYTLSPAAPIANLFCVPLATGILVCGLLGSLLCLIPPFSVLGILVIWIAKGMASLIGFIARLLAKIPCHQISQATPISFIVILLLIGVCLWFWFYPKSLRPIMKAVVLGVLCLSVFLSSFMPAFLPKTEEFCFLVNTYNNALVVVSGNTALYLGDTMTYELEQYLGSRGVDELSLWVLPKKSSYYTSLTKIPGQFTINKIMTYPQAVPYGYLPQINASTSIHCSNTLQVGTITVTVLDDFHSFEITTQNTTLYYNFNASQNNPTVPFAFVHHNASNNRTHTLTVKEVCYPLTQTTVIRISPNHHRMYHPTYWY